MIAFDVRGRGGKRRGRRGRRVRKEKAILLRKDRLAVAPFVVFEGATLSYRRSPPYRRQFNRRVSDTTNIHHSNLCVLRVSANSAFSAAFSNYSREALGYLLEKTGFRVLESTPFKQGRFARVIAERL